MPRRPKIVVADPLSFDHEADADFIRDTHGLPGGGVLLTTAELAKRERKTPDAIRKERARGTGPPFIVLGRRCIRYRLIDVVNHEANRVAYSLAEARAIGLL
jgi:hypothetical protein